ncbi:MAG: hypothetical protein ABL962_20045, partial [Fimbriimonadaceae bacterium]
MRFFKTYLGTCLFALAAMAETQPGGGGFQFPAGNGATMPLYFAGTNCRVSGGANLGYPIAEAKLFLVTSSGETEVASFYADDAEMPMSISLSAMFDS